MWVTIRGNGTVEIPVVETARKDIPPDYLEREDIRVKVRPAGDPTSGRGQRGTMFYLQSQFGSGGLLAGDHCTLT